MKYIVKMAAAALLLATASKPLMAAELNFASFTPPPHTVSASLMEKLSAGVSASSKVTTNVFSLRIAFTAVGANPVLFCCCVLATRASCCVICGLDSFIGSLPAPLGQHSLEAV